LKYRMAGTNAPGSALWSQCRVHRGWLFIAYSLKVVHRALHGGAKMALT
jgi:hypothetical protein